MVGKGRDIDRMTMRVSFESASNVQGEVNTVQSVNGRPKPRGEIQGETIKRKIEKRRDAK